jgi:hypothetical protein
MVLWPSGLGGGLQNPIHRFEPYQRLKRLKIMREVENDSKVVLTGTYEGSYNKLRHSRVNRNNNKKFNLNAIKLFFKKRKK